MVGYLSVELPTDVSESELCLTTTPLPPPVLTSPILFCFHLSLIGSFLSHSPCIFLVLHSRVILIFWGQREASSMVPSTSDLHSVFFPILPSFLSCLCGGSERPFHCKAHKRNLRGKSLFGGNRVIITASAFPRGLFSAGIPGFLLKEELLLWTGWAGATCAEQRAGADRKQASCTFSHKGMLPGACKEKRKNGLWSLLSCSFSVFT